jgi:MFS family permease
MRSRAGPRGGGRLRGGRRRPPAALDWRAVFLVNLPVCAVGALLAPRVLVESRGEGRRLDLNGAIAVTTGLALLILGLTRVEAVGVAHPWTIASVAGGLVALVAFAAVERRAPDPILPPAALRRPAFAAASGAAVALTAATTPPMFLTILYQQETLGRSALVTGLWCAPFNLAVIGGSLLGPRAGARWAPGAVMAAGLCGVAAGALVLVDQSPATLLPAFLLMGAGLGCAAVASTASGTAALPAAEQGIASGVLTAAAQIGTALGLALLVSLAAARGYDWGFAGAAMMALAAAATITRSSPRSRRRPTTPPP